MLVRFSYAWRFLFTILFSCFVTFCAYADTNTSSCEADEKFYNGIAQKILALLDDGTTKGLVSSVKEYNNHLQQSVFDPNGACYLLNMEIVQDESEVYDWSGFDLSGASMVSSGYKNDIQEKLNSMDLSKIDIDLSPYDYKNDRRISSANIRLKIAKDGQQEAQILQNLAIYKQCKIDIFNLNQEQSNIKEMRNNVSLYLTTLANPQSTTCTCDESGNLTACSTVSESTPQEASTDDLSCKNLNQYASDTAFCPTCIIFERILIADQKLAGGSFSVLSGSLIKILGIAFLIYLAYQTLILVASPANQPISKYLTSVVLQGFKITIAVLILSNPSFLYNLALKPILEGSLDFGITLTGKAQSHILESGAKYTKFNNSDTLLSAPFLQKMVGTAESFNTQAAIMPAMGKSLICNAFSNLDWNIIPNLETLLEGFLVIIFGYIISFSVGFYLLDITLELGFFCCLLPFLIACWPFKITLEYCKKGWGIFMHIFFTYVMLGVIITTINAITKRALAPNHDVNELIKALNDNNFDFIKDAMSFGGSQLLFLIVSCYICLKLLQDVDNLANKFAGGSGIRLSSKFAGGVMASAGISTIVNGGTTALNVAKAGARGASEVGNAMGVNGAIKAGADHLGFSQMKNYFSQKRAQGKQFVNDTLGSMGIGRSAVVRGGRNGGENSNNQNGGTQS